MSVEIPTTTYIPTNTFNIETPIHEEPQMELIKYRFKKTQPITYYLEKYKYSGLTRQTIQQLYNNTHIVELEPDIFKDDVRVYIPHPGNEHRQVTIYTSDLEPAVAQELSSDTEWSNERNRTLYFNVNTVKDQIRVRYAFLERPSSGLSNIIIDSYAPRLMYLSDLSPSRLDRIQNLPKTAYAISPWFAQYFGVQQVSSEQLCRTLGYSLKDLKNLVTKVKRKNMSVTFIGYGGTNVNTIHWLTEIMKITQSVNLFNFIEVFEPDTLEVSNLLRFPKNPYLEYGGYRNSGTSKLRLLDVSELKLLSKNKPTISTRTITTNFPHECKGVVWNSEAGRKIPKSRHVFYGAPDINTRSLFEDVGHFVSATHSGNTAHLWLNPVQDTDLQVESYGLIELTPFFMNQLRLAIGFLEYLSIDDIDLKAKDELLLEYSFDGVPKLPTNRVYNYQLNTHDGNVATEDEADVAF